MWLIQNILIVTLTISLLYQLFTSGQILDLIRPLYEIFILLLLLDLFAVSLICFRMFHFFWKNNDRQFHFKKMEFSIPSFGFLWVTLMLIKRIPAISFLLSHYNPNDVTYLTELHYASFFIIGNFNSFFLYHLATFFLLIFLILLSSYLNPIFQFNHYNDIDYSIPGTLILFGVLNLSGLIFFRLDFYLSIVVLLLKVFVVPIFGILTSKKLFFLKNRPYPDDNFIIQIRSSSLLKF